MPSAAQQSPAPISAQYPDSPAENGGWKVKTIGASSTAQKPHGSPEAGGGGENDRRGPRKRWGAPGGAKGNGAARRRRACGTPGRASTIGRASRWEGGVP